MVNNSTNEDLLKKYPIIKFINDIPDPRAQSFHFQHSLVSIIFIVLVTGLCGANDWVGVVEMAQSMKNWIAQYVPLPHGIPSHDTFGRVFSMICPKQFNKFLINWSSLLREINDGQELISFDGKTLCGTAEKALGLKGLHILNAWSQDNGICIGQFKVDDKSNEITAIPQLIKLLDLKNCLVTCDALNTQKNNAKAVIDAQADYVFPVKENHSGLREDIELLFKDAIKKDFKGIDADHFETIDKDHGRIEKRTYHVIDGEDLPDRIDWIGLKSLGMVIRERTVNSKTTIEIVYYILSTEINAKLFEKATRGHWGVEIFHWKLDVVLREDNSRYRDRIGAQNLAVIRKVTLGMLSKDKTKKCGLATKRLVAAADVTYRESILKKFL